MDDISDTSCFATPNIQKLLKSTSSEDEETLYTFLQTPSVAKLLAKTDTADTIDTKSLMTFLASPTLKKLLAQPCRKDQSTMTGTYQYIVCSARVFLVEVTLALWREEKGGKKQDGNQGGTPSVVPTNCY